jgi:hypothetical protein
MLRKAACFVLILSLAAGCAVPPVAEHCPGGPSESTEAPANTYALYEHGRETVYAQVRLTSPAPVGFAKEEDGKLLAVAGETAFPLADGHYDWRPVPEDLATAWLESLRALNQDNRPGTSDDPFGRSGNLLLAACKVASLLAGQR